MRGADVQRVFETILPDNVLMKLVESAKFQERARKLDALRLLRSMIIAAATGYGGRQADVMRLYFESGATRVVRGVFYGWFGKELEAIMVEVRALVQDHPFAVDVGPRSTRVAPRRAALRRTAS